MSIHNAELISTGAANLFEAMYPISGRESERLVALGQSHILDSGPSPEFDAVVAHVRDLLDVPICLVSLLDGDRQWFKAKCGIEIEGTERRLAFCNYALLSEDVFVVEDAASDPRFMNHPLVAGAPHVRFYAGAPLMIAPGIALGTLCAIGVEPRSLSTGEAVALQRLAKIVTGLVRGHGLAIDAARLARDVEIKGLVVQDQAQDLYRRERRFKQTERIAKLGGWEVDLATNAVVWSDEVYRICEVPPDTPLDLERALSIYSPSEQARLKAVIRGTLSNGIGFDEEFAFDAPSGAQRWVRMLGEVEVVDGAPRRLFGTFQDVSQRHRAEARLWTAANTDSLTGLANRKRFDEILGSALSVPGPPVGLLMLDADRLKEVNDTLGHDAGDALIRVIARRLTKAVGLAGMVVARLGGDEFAVLIPAPVSAEGLDAMGRRIRTGMSPSFTFKSHVIKPSVSIGASLGDATCGSEALRQSADLALYHAKVTRRGGYALFHEGLKSAITARIAAVNVIDDALVSGDIHAWYQPVVDLATGRVSGLEALARVQRGDAILSIAAFAHALDDSRTATRVTACMLNRIAADVAAWRAAGIEVPRIAFNVGTLDFQDETIEPQFLAMCERAGVPPSQFSLEVTESVFLSRSADIVAKTAARLRARGMVVALDDFGTGHASLAHLGTFPVDIIKMDRSFTLRMNDRGPGGVIATALINLAHKLQIKVIAEGVENSDELDHLMALGCEMAQGHLFSCALPPAEIGSFLDAFRMTRRAA